MEAPELSVADIVRRAERYRQGGADVIDVGCLPGTPFPHLRDAIQALKDVGFRVSVDSLNVDDLRCGGRAGALISVARSTLNYASRLAKRDVLSA